jgi:hypothetical protein
LEVDIERTKIIRRSEAEIKGIRGSKKIQQTEKEDQESGSRGTKTVLEAKVLEKIDPNDQDGEVKKETGSRGTKEVLEEIAREKRERKAARKPDGALVPEYLWEEHLLHDCPTPWVLK